MRAQHRRILPFCTCAILLIAPFGQLFAQSTSTYSYDNLKRLTQASATSGESLQYDYDPDGNLVSINTSNATTLSLNHALDVNIQSPGEGVTVSFSATAGQALSLNLNSVSTTPGGGSVSVSVLNSAGQVVATTTVSESAAISMPSLAAGTYSLVVAPPAGEIATFEMSLEQSGSNNEVADTDGPMPSWAYVAMALAMIFLIAQQQIRSRRRLP